MAPVINYLTKEMIAERRAELLGRTNLSLDELRKRNSSYMLDADEQAILRALEDLVFLETGDDSSA
jgi:hypothetical protein